jgi:hypothetical protein
VGYPDGPDSDRSKAQKECEMDSNDDSRVGLPSRTARPTGWGKIKVKVNSGQSIKTSSATACPDFIKPTGNSAQIWTRPYDGRTKWSGVCPGGGFRSVGWKWVSTRSCGSQIFQCCLPCTAKVFIFNPIIMWT